MYHKQINLCLSATKKQMLSLKFMTRCVYAQPSKQRSHPPHLPPSVPLHPLFDLLLLQIFGRFLPLRSSGLLQLHLPRVPSAQQTLSHPVHICPPSVPLYQPLDWKWAQTGLMRHTVVETKCTRTLGNSGRIFLSFGPWRVQMFNCVGYLCWKCGPTPRCGPATFWCWGFCAAPPAWPSSCRKCSSSAGGGQRREKKRLDHYQPNWRSFRVPPCTVCLVWALNHWSSPHCCRTLVPPSK